MFLEQVTLWQRKLGTVDVVLNTWSDVQRKWQAWSPSSLGRRTYGCSCPATPRASTPSMSTSRCRVGGLHALEGLLNVRHYTVSGSAAVFS